MAHTFLSARNSSAVLHDFIEIQVSQEEWLGQKCVKLTGIEKEIKNDGTSGGCFLFGRHDREEMLGEVRAAARKADIWTTLRHHKAPKCGRSCPALRR